MHEILPQNIEPLWLSDPREVCYKDFSLVCSMRILNWNDEHERDSSVWNSLLSRMPTVVYGEKKIKIRLEREIATVTYTKSKRLTYTCTGQSCGSTFLICRRRFLFFRWCGGHFRHKIFFSSLTSFWKNILPKKNRHTWKSSISSNSNFQKRFEERVEKDWERESKGWHVQREMWFTICQVE